MNSDTDVHLSYKTIENYMQFQGFCIANQWRYKIGDVFTNFPNALNRIIEIEYLKLMLLSRGTSYHKPDKKNIDASITQNLAIEDLEFDFEGMKMLNKSKGISHYLKSTPIISSPFCDWEYWDTETSTTGNWVTLDIDQELRDKIVDYYKTKNIQLSIIPYKNNMEFNLAADCIQIQGGSTIKQFMLRRVINNKYNLHFNRLYNSTIHNNNSNNNSNPSIHQPIDNNIIVSIMGLFKVGKTLIFNLLTKVTEPTEPTYQLNNGCYIDQRTSDGVVYLDQTCPIVNIPEKVQYNELLYQSSDILIIVLSGKMQEKEYLKTIIEMFIVNPKPTGSLLVIHNYKDIKDHVNLHKQFCIDIGSDETMKTLENGFYTHNTQGIELIHYLLGDLNSSILERWHNKTIESIIQFINKLPKYRNSINESIDYIKNHIYKFNNLNNNNLFINSSNSNSNNSKTSSTPKSKKIPKTKDFKLKKSNSPTLSSTLQPIRLEIIDDLKSEKPFPRNYVLGHILVPPPIIRVFGDFDRDGAWALCQAEPNEEFTCSSFDTAKCVNDQYQFNYIQVNRKKGSKTSSFQLIFYLFSKTENNQLTQLGRVESIHIGYYQHSYFLPNPILNYAVPSIIDIGRPMSFITLFSNHFKKTKHPMLIDFYLENNGMTSNEPMATVTAQSLDDKTFNIKIQPPSLPIGSYLIVCRFSFKRRDQRVPKEKGTGLSIHYIDSSISIYNSNSITNSKNNDCNKTSDYDDYTTFISNYQVDI
ncbi:hypothetical protein DLAC_09232 [Tieghemostelium lacteum]|uniref:Uncharacterized protein n=1 Tax=Tieghemostelium lacteum TaxID=361077 RepID=A0A151Z9J5_TIELA|nr:hypothetical protein DLAC_09232 [Tieghemostelium lacteum]|eukprot:KYQ90603.1 hypothetical protein DLAC_09232 [Tieghemostelium lacteum]